MDPDGEVTRFIAAPASVVFAAITDITRMGDWSPETVRAEWSEGHERAAVGARYVGHNKLGDNEWSIEAEIVELVEGERFSFECLSPRTGSTFARWGYTIKAAEGGCEVTEQFQDLRDEQSKARGSAMTGVTDRAAHNLAGMEQTLERLAAACEAG